MKIGNIIIVILLIALAGMFAYSTLRKTGNAIETGDVFEGVITNMQLSPQTIDGTGVYDRSCNPVENGLTQCDAGIQTSEGLLNFNYKHNMHMQECIDAGQNLKVEILDGGGARVTRY